MWGVCSQSNFLFEVKSCAYQLFACLFCVPGFLAQPCDCKKKVDEACCAEEPEECIFFFAAKGGSSSWKALTAFAGLKGPSFKLHIVIAGATASSSWVVIENEYWECKVNAMCIWHGTSVPKVFND